jgi:hypothetical protein
LTDSYLATFADGTYCSGFDFNLKQNYVYVGCFSATIDSTPGKLDISIFDLTSKTVISTLSGSQNAGFSIKNRLQIKLLQPVPDQVQSYLLAYDQGAGNSAVSGFNAKNSKFAIFDNADSKDLSFAYVGDIPDYEADGTILYDIFPNHSNILISGRVAQSSDQISLNTCSIDHSNRSLNCDPE